MEDILKSLFQRLLKWDVLRSLGMKDILFDPSSGLIAISVLPLKFELYLKIGFLNNVDYQLNTSLARLFDYPMETEKWPNSWRVKETRPMWFHGEGRPNSDERGTGEHINDFLTGIVSAIRDTMVREGAEDVGDGNLTCTIQPEPGYPWTPKTTEIYSTKRNKMVKVDRPAWVIQIEDREKQKRWAVDFCKLMPLVCPSGGHSLVGSFEAREMQFFVTHCAPVWQGGKVSAVQPEWSDRLKSCPGMLFPSLATGLIPSTNFGETVFVARPDMILSSMKPYKQRGQWSVVTYDTDVWTETTGAFMSDIAIATFNQLHGDGDWMYSSHLYILGPSVKDTGFADEDVKPIDSTKRLAGAMGRRFKKWNRDLSFRKFVELSSLMSGDRYGYLESKCNVILSWDCLPLAVTPRPLAEQVDKQIRAMGFKGQLLGVDVPEDVLYAITKSEAPPAFVEYFIKQVGKTSESASTLRVSAHDYLIFTYAWLVRDAILEFAQSQQGAVFTVVE